MRPHVIRPIQVGLLLALGFLGSPADAQVRFFPERCPRILFFDPCPASSLARVPASRPDGAPSTHERPRQEPKAEARTTPVTEEHLFAEPHVGPDGMLRLYLPPKPVREFLQNPTPENARAYRDWNLKRFGNLTAAQAVLDELNGVPRERGLASASPSSRGVLSVGTPLADQASPDAAPPKVSRASSVSPPVPATVGVAAQTPSRAGRTELVYLFATWCGFSARQTPLVTAFARAHPEVPVTGIALDSPPETIPPYAAELPFPVRAGGEDDKVAWRVRAYPTLVILKDRVPVRTLTGLTPLAALRQAVGLNGATAAAPALQPLSGEGET